MKEGFNQLLLNDEYEGKAYNRIDALTDVVPEVTSPCGEAVLCRAIFVTLENIYERPKSIV
jgi:hypothetical protein